MKKNSGFCFLTLFGFCGALLLAISLPAFAAEPISGLLKEVSTPKHENSHIIFPQDGNTLWVACYWEHEGASIVWHGMGVVWGNKIEYALKHTRLRSGWDPSGKHKLILSTDGRMLNGTWRNSRGESGPLKFIRVK